MMTRIEIVEFMKANCPCRLDELARMSKEELIDFLVYFMKNHSSMILDLRCLVDYSVQLNETDWSRIVSSIGKDSVYSYYLLGFISSYCYFDREYLLAIGFSENELDERFSGDPFSLNKGEKKKIAIEKYNRMLVNSYGNGFTKNDVVSLFNLFSYSKEREPLKLLELMSLSD